MQNCSNACQSKIIRQVKQLAILASASALINYLAVVLATLKLRKTNTSTSENSFRVPGGVLVPILAALAIVWLLSNLTKEELISFAVFFAIFSLLFLLLKKLKKIS
jgi:L-asparagine transporter-like permease